MIAVLDSLSYATVNSRRTKTKARHQGMMLMMKLHSGLAQPVHSLGFRRCVLRVDGNDFATTSSHQQDALHPVRQHVEEFNVYRAPAKVTKTS